MSATAVCEEQVQVRRERRPCGARGITLGQLLTRAHEGVHARGTADCPVCGGTLVSHGRRCRVHELWQPARLNAPRISLLVMQPRAGRENRRSRKVRTPQSGVVGKPDPAKAAGKCHRKQPPKRGRRTCRPRRQG